MPMSKHTSFINAKKKSAFGSAQRCTLFSGKNRQYDSVYTKMAHLAYDITKKCPNPDKYNVRDSRDPRASFNIKNISTSKTSFSY